jgi:serine protease AprX
VTDFHAVPTPLRLGADPRFRGKGRTVALVDAAFFPHPDLARPTNRILAWVNATTANMIVRRFTPDDVPVWPELPDDSRGAEWHGLMTSATAAGNGWLSRGLYRGLASESHVVLVQVSNGHAITNGAIARALQWLRTNARDIGLSVVSLSVAGDEPALGEISPVDDEVEALVADGVVVVAAAGNDGTRHLLPPATCPDAITVGGLDDHNVLSQRDWEIWHSNFGTTRCNVNKPEVVAPSLWTVAPVLPGSDVADEARRLFEQRAISPSVEVDRRIAELRLVTPQYQHVEGTSFAAPIVASIASCMLEANPHLTPERIKRLLMLSATRLANASEERQGAGVVNAGRAVAAALADAVTPAA